MEKVEPLVKPWYDAMEEGRLIARKCKNCGHIEFPPRYVCNECGCLDTEWTELSGKAQVTFLLPPSPMRMNPQLMKMFGGYLNANVEVEGTTPIDAITSVLVKVGVDRYDELTAKLPLPVKPVFVQLDGYKMVYWELDE